MRLRYLVTWLQRFFEVNSIVFSRIFLALARLLLGRPTQGAELMRDGLEKIGGCFIKLGQIMSLQIDTLPKEYCDALLTLLDRVPTCSREEVDSIISTELGALPDELYNEFDYVAIGSASIGQVHKARLKDGTPVAIKVQRPGVRQAFQRDLQLMRTFVWFIFMFGIRSLYFMRDPIRELYSWTGDELDYRREATQCNMLFRNAAGSTTERIPHVYWNLSTGRVLTMEFLQGPSVSTYIRMVERNDTAAIQALKDTGFEPSVFCNNIIANFLRDAFHHGAFHADLHPANLLILPNNVVGYVDFGIVAKLTPEARRKQIELTLAYASGLSDSIHREFLNICMLTDNADVEGMRRKIAEMSRTWYAQPFINGQVRFKVTVTKAMMDLLEVCRTHGVLVDREMIKYIRSTVLVDGLVTHLAPGFDIAGALRRAVENYMIEESQRKVLSPGGMLSFLTDVTVWMQSGPTSMVRALDQFERRQIVFRASVSQPPRKQDAAVLRLYATAATLVITILFLTLTNGWPDFARLTFSAYISVAFVTSWSLWLLTSLWRQFRARPIPRN
ncbi:MAG: hypothetical protein JWN34_5211 [Bryobacterales bacterium]|nr:hypothetical protein [Bryobacterales bacterium]